jgi:NADH dehydrogenase
MRKPASNRVLITGGDTFTGINIASAVLADGAEVTLLIREGNAARLGPLAERVQWHVADVWDAASLKGRARGHHTVIHTVGSMTDDPARGLTFQRLNVTSARHVANMCVSDGVSHMVLLSAARAPWVNGQYISAKRDAEAYVRRMGLRASIVRAPLTYVRGTSRPVFYRLMTLLGTLPPLSWTALGNMAPIPMDVLARGVARLALNPPTGQRIYQARELRRLNTADERRGLRIHDHHTDTDTAGTQSSAPDIAMPSRDISDDETLPRRPSE